MTGKIALEEHFITPDLIEKVTGGLPDPPVWEEAKRRLLDLTDERLEDMDRAGIDLSLLSVTGPAVQGEIDTAAAVRMARGKNDYLAEASRLVAQRRALTSPFFCAEFNSWSLSPGTETPSGRSSRIYQPMSSLRRAPIAAMSGWGSRS
jgi:hypothetical protein